MRQPLFKPGWKPRRRQIRQKVNEDFDGTVVVVIKSECTTKKLHVSRGGETPSSLCGCATAGEWKEKPLAVFPPRNKDWCSRCLARLFPERSTLKEARQ